MVPAVTLHALERDFRRQVLIHALDAHQNNIISAAEALGLQRTYLHKLIRDHQIPRLVKPPEPKGRTPWVPSSSGS